MPKSRKNTQIPTDQNSLAKPSGRGGAGRGQGRKPIGDEPTIGVTLRMTPDQRDKLSALGGAKWVRAQIDRAKVSALLKKHAEALQGLVDE